MGKIEEGNKYDRGTIEKRGRDKPATMGTKIDFLLNAVRKLLKISAPRRVRQGDFQSILCP